MALKHVRALSTLHEVASYSFRNTSEVLECVSKIGAEARANAANLRYAGRTLVSASALREDLLQKNYEIADDLQHKLDMLDSLHMQLKYNFSGSNGQADALKHLITMRGHISRRIDQAYQFLNDAAVKNVPAEVMEMFNHCCSELIGKINTPLRTSNQLYLHLGPPVQGAKEPTHVYSRYLCLENFKDDTGFVHPQFYVVYTATVDPLGIKYFVNTLSHFVVPGKFKVGKQFVECVDGLDRTGELLDAENFSALSKRLPLPVKRVTTNDLQKSRRWVADVTVVDHEIRVKLAVGVGKLKVGLVVEKLTSDIAGVLSRFTTGRLRFKTRWYGRQYIVTYTLVMPEFTPHKLITVEQMEGLKNLGFDDLDIGRLHQALNRGA